MTCSPRPDTFPDNWKTSRPSIDFTTKRTSAAADSGRSKMNTVAPPEGVAQRRRFMLLAFEGEEKVESTIRGALAVVQTALQARNSAQSFNTYNDHQHSD